MKTKLAILLVTGLACSLFPGQATAAAAKPAAGELVDVQLPNADIADAITLISKMAGMNVDIDSRLRPSLGPDGKTSVPAKVVTVNYEQITPMNALLATLDANDLQLVTNTTTGTFLVKPRDPKALPPLMTEVFLLQYGTTNVVPIVKGTMTDTRSQVLANDRASQLIVIATEPELALARDLITQLDVRPRQVHIAAQLVETSMNPSSLRGFDWAGTLEAQNFGWGNGTTTGTATTSIPGTGSTTTTTLPGGRTITTTATTPATKAIDLVTDMGLGGITANTFNGFNPALGILNADGVRGVFSFMTANSETEVIATPSTVTMDNVQARLEVIRAFPVFTQNPGSAQVAATTELTYTNVGTILVVTPRVSGHSNIFLKVTPEVSNIDGQNRQTINGQVNEANVYASRKIDTQVLIPSGNTLVMGGLVSDTQTRGNSKVPILGDAPGPFGYLFRRDTKSRTKSNLLIFVTPTLVEDYDFQYAGPNTFLRQTIKPMVDAPESILDTGKPKKWTGSANK